MLATFFFLVLGGSDVHMYVYASNAAGFGSKRALKGFLVIKVSSWRIPFELLYVNRFGLSGHALYHGLGRAISLSIAKQFFF